MMNSPHVSSTTEQNKLRIYRIHLMLDAFAFFDSHVRESESVQAVWALEKRLQDQRISDNLVIKTTYPFDVELTSS